MKQLLIPVALMLAVGTAEAKIDKGGYVFEYALRSKVPQRINHPCYSSCTLYLVNPRTCAGPNASFHFHAPYGTKHDVRIKRWMMGLYPSKVRRWIQANGGLTKTWITLRGAEMRRIVRAC